MSDFNYQEYLKNNPLLQKEVKEEQLITEAEDKDVEEVMGIDRKGNKKPDVEMSKAAKAKQDAKDVKEEEVTENRPHPTEVFSDEELDYIGDMLVAMYEKLGLEKSPGETDVVKAGALMDRIEGFFETLNEEKVTEEVTEEEIQEEVPSSKMKVSELKAKIKEDIISLLQEEEEEEVEVEDEVDVEVDTEEPALDAGTSEAGLSKDEQEIQDSLKLAYDNAVAIGDQKLADQIGNSITFFTRSHVVER